MENLSLSKSPSTDSFLKQKKYVTIEFEGDGNLGIFFKFLKILIIHTITP